MCLQMTSKMRQPWQELNRFPAGPVQCFVNHAIPFLRPRKSLTIRMVKPHGAHEKIINDGKIKQKRLFSCKDRSINAINASNTCLLIICKGKID